MATTKNIPADLPEKMQSGVARYLESLQEVFSDNLLSVLLYGSAARGEYVPGVSDLNLLVVLKDARTREVKKVADASKRAWDKYGIQPRFMSLETIRTASDVLPIAFLDIKEKYLLLFGEDVFQDVVIERKNLRYQCEYQLRFVLLRMRNRYVFSYGDPKRMASQLTASFTNFLYLLKSLFWLVGEEAPGRFTEVMSRSAERFGLDLQLMQEILELKRSPRSFNQEKIESLYEGYLDLLYDLTAVVDKMETE